MAKTLLLAGPVGFFYAWRIVNVFPVVAFTFFGLLTNYTNVTLLVFALIKIIFYDIFKFTEMNPVISPDIARCKAAVDDAIVELQSRKMKHLQESTAAGLNDAVGISQSSCRALLENQQKVLLILCEEYILDWTPDMFPRSKSPLHIQGLQESAYDDIKHKLQERVINSWVKHMIFGTVSSFVTIAVLGTLQVLLVHAGDISLLGNSNFDSGLIIPIITAISTLLGSEKKNTVFTHQLSSAKTYFLILSELNAENRL